MREPKKCFVSNFPMTREKNFTCEGLTRLILSRSHGRCLGSVVVERAPFESNGSGFESPPGYVSFSFFLFLRKNSLN